ncbi:MAG TPA: quinohemoprotein amine dehydrogenase maturation protein [Myxococcota bacterium]|nr:quinohemoprotein amine dehydrogenase maturation protein [Myxococcota bacterium]
MHGAVELVPHNLHRVAVDGRELLFHVPTTSLFELDAPARDVLDLVAAAPLSLMTLQEKLSSRHDARAVAEAIAELTACEVLRDSRAHARAPAAKKRVTSFPLTTVVLNVATGCNLACGYCFKEDLTSVAKSEVMDFATAQAAIEMLLRESPGRARYNVVFFGGEPLTQMPLLERVVAWGEERFAEAGARADFSLTTNATLITPRIADWLNAHNVGVAVSIDGPRAVHDRHRTTRSGRGSYGAVASKVRLLRERYRARPLGARVTLARGTTEVGEIFDHLSRELGFDEVGFAPVTAGDDARFNLSEPELDAVFDGFRALGDELVVAALRGEKLGFSNLLQLLSDLYYGTSKSLPCGAGYSLVAIDHQGGVNLCHRFTGSQLGTFGDVAHGLARPELSAFLERRLDKSGVDCATCRIRNLCSGGCYHESYARYGDPIRPTLHYCDRMRAWIDYGISAYARILSAKPEWFSRTLAPRRATS